MTSLGTQPDRAVDRPTTPGDLRVAVLGHKIIAKESRPPGLGVRDQRFRLGQFQGEVVAEVVTDSLLDLFGFTFRSGEA